MFLSLYPSFIFSSDGIANSNQDYMGVECYHVKREKKNGGEQTGTLCGVRWGYERIKRYRYYIGLEGVYAKGDLKGKVSDQKIQSTLMDLNVEGRFGYTIQAKSGMRPSLTPFVGFGYFLEKNCYHDPTPIHPHFSNRFAYISFGFLSHVYLSCKFGIGLNVRVRYLTYSQVKVSNDSFVGDHTQLYEDKMHYRVELPLTYDPLFDKYNLTISLIPFYEYRPYGYRVNFPHDFIETTYKLTGVSLKLSYLF